MTHGRTIALADEAYMLCRRLRALGLTDDRADRLVERAEERMARRRSLVSVLCQRRMREMGVYR